jgi:hypothetical protein
MAKAWQDGLVESRAEWAGEAPGRLAVVELQQFCFGLGNDRGVRHPN